MYKDTSASVKRKDRWNEIDLGREIVEADDNKIMRIHLQNNEVETFVDFPVRSYRLLPHQDTTGDFDVRILSFIIPDGDTDQPSDVGQFPLNIARKRETPVTTQKLLIQSESFGNAPQKAWRSFVLTISLRSGI